MKHDENGRPARGVVVAVRALAWLAVLAVVLASDGRSLGAGSPNLVRDPSFETLKEKDRHGRVFQHWGGWVYDGEAEFRASDLARTGHHSLLLVGGSAPKIRAWPEDVPLPPGRYRVTAYLRGLDIGKGPWEQATEFAFDGNYFNLGKSGTFGWSKLTYVGEVKETKKQTSPSFGLLVPGYFWVDDVTVEPVPADTPLTASPQVEAETSLVVSPDIVTEGAVPCPECAYRNMPKWGRCYACGTPLAAARAASGPAEKLLADCDSRSGWEGGKPVAEHVTQGKGALRLDSSYALLNARQDWRGYDFLRVDLFTPAATPLKLNVEIHDDKTRDYWTRVNYETVVPPGASTLVLPVRGLYVGEKSRPGRPLDLAAITRLGLSIGEKPAGPLFIDNVRLQRDTEAEARKFPGLWAFDLGLRNSPLMEGFTRLSEERVYSRGRGWGLKSAQVWRGVDALQPDPLYQDFLCIQKGGLAVDVPNGKYHVFVNVDSPSGYWGEYQTYRERTIRVEGKKLSETMDFEGLKARYFRHWLDEDLPTDNTFDKYQMPYFSEKELDVEVRDGQLNVEFQGDTWACAVSAIVIYPLEKEAEGRRFLQFVRERRRFHFDNYFKRTLHAGGKPGAPPSATERDRGFSVFVRHFMSPVYYDDRPTEAEKAAPLAASAFRGEMEPLTFGVVPYRDLGVVTASVSDLRGPGGSVIPSEAVRPGYVQYRLSRVTMEGSVYTIEPRYVVPRASVACPAGVTRRFWFTVHVPSSATPGEYRGVATIAAAKGGRAEVPVTVRVQKGDLALLDVPAGPWGHTIDFPRLDVPAALPQIEEWNRTLTERSLQKLVEYGFTTASGLPEVRYLGFKGGRPVLDFVKADEQMRRFKSAGFRLPVVSYVQLGGLNLYARDTAAAEAAGFSDYAAFLRQVFGALQAHADAQGWLPVYWTLGDEPLGDALTESLENALAYRRAFPDGPPFFTAATSYAGADPKDPHFLLSKAVHVAAWNLHSEESVNLLRKAGGQWGYYNGASRWTYGAYLYKAVKEFALKFRIAWHWNSAAGDPYYALDCREDDYSWCNTNPSGELIPSVQFEQLREGLGDYRRLLTLALWAKSREGTPAGDEAAKVVAEVLRSFRFGTAATKPPFAEAGWGPFRAGLDAALDGRL